MRSVRAQSWREKRSPEHLRNARGARGGLGSRSGGSRAWPRRNKGPIRSQWDVTPRALQGCSQPCPAARGPPEGRMNSLRALLAAVSLR